MPEYIKRETSIKRVMETKWESGSDGAAAMEIVAATPAAEVSPVRHGRWVKIYESGEPAIEQHQVGVFCSRCMKMPKDRFTESDFCPNCGAKMDGVDDE